MLKKKTAPEAPVKLRAQNKRRSGDGGRARRDCQRCFRRWQLDQGKTDLPALFDQVVEALANGVRELKPGR
jgi:hypothetical protein